MTKYYYLCKVSIESTLKEFIRYRFNAVSEVLYLYILFLAMFLGIKSFGTSFGISPIDMGSNLEGFIVGYFLWNIIVTAYSNVAYGITSDANRGTLEQLNMSSIKLSTIVTVRSLSNLLINLVVSAVLLFIIIITTNYQFKIKIFSILLPIFMGIFGILGIGLIFGGLALVFKKVQSLLNIVQYFFIAFMMVSPKNEIIYNLLPFRPAADMVMATMRKGLSLIDFSIFDYIFMIGNSVLYFSIGLLVFNRCIKLAKNKGLLGQY